jgi:drug/metabolite transporter (DMT)-like permease
VSARAWAAFAAVSVLWGIPYLFIKVAVDDGIPPAFLAWVRVVLGSAVLLVLAWRAGVLGSVRGRLGVLAVYALIEIALPFPLIAEGERHVSSSLAAILIATVPMNVALLALRFDASERVTGVRAVGLVLGFAGVVALVGIDLGGELVGAVAILLAAVGYAAGPMLLNHRFRDLDPRATMAVSLLIAGVYLTPFAVAKPPAGATSGEALAALVVLGVLCTAAAFVFFGALIAEVGPGRAAIITYVAPVVAVLLGVLVLDETLGAGALVGLVLILAGSWLATDGRLPRRRVVAPN